MKNNNTIESVVRDGLCTGCGTCVGLCPIAAIEMGEDNSKGIYIPRLDEEKCNGCGICIDICPGHAVDFRQLNSELFSKQPEDILLGNYLNCYTGYATDYDIRYNSASGGLVTALLVFALEQGIIDGALVTKMSEDNPLEPQPFIARTREEILSAAKSKYCPVPANIALKEILEKDGKFAVVGLPCHIHGIRKAEAVNKKLSERIILHLGIFCSHPMSFCGTRFLFNRYGIKRADIAILEYRGNGWPGYMTIQLKNGTKKIISLNEYIVFQQLGFFTPVRCALCYDQTAEFSDISCGDAWLHEILAEDNVGTSIIISRSGIGESLLKRATSKGEIAINSIRRDKVKETVPRLKKTDYKAKSHLVSLMGKKRPTYRTELPIANFSAYRRSLQLYLSIFLSRHCFWWLIRPLARLELIGVLAKAIIMRLLGKLIKSTGLGR